MAKIQTQPRAYLPQSDWEKDIWYADDYKKHDSEFRTILKEYREISAVVYSAVMCRWYWLEKKGAIRMAWYENRFGEKYMEPFVRSTYTRYSNMFSRFNEWLSFEEKKEEALTGIPLPTMDEVRQKVDMEKLRHSFSTPVDFGEAKPLALSAPDKDFDDFTEKAVANF